MVLHDEKSWPRELVVFLEKEGINLLGQKLTITNNNYSFDADLNDRLHRKLTNLLSDFTIENAYHCTRLTNQEINFIKLNGMQLPNQGILNLRIDQLVKSGLISVDISDKLKARNESNSSYRKGMLYFVFQSPNLEDERGISRFFTSWGGEALYNSHEDDPVTGSILQKIGRPCIVQARIPITNLSCSSINDKIARIFFENRGMKFNETNLHEDYITETIPSYDIISIFEYPEKEFNELSGCENWKDTKLYIFQ